MENWFVWRPVKEGLATLKEVQNEWTLLDLLEAHRTLDKVAEAQRNG